MYTYTWISKIFSWMTKNATTMEFLLNFVSIASSITLRTHWTKKIDTIQRQIKKFFTPKSEQFPLMKCIHRSKFPYSSHDWFAYNESKYCGRFKTLQQFPVNWLLLNYHRQQSRRRRRTCIKLDIWFQM